MRGLCFDPQCGGTWLLEDSNVCPVCSRSNNVKAAARRLVEQDIGECLPVPEDDRLPKSNPVRICEALGCGTSITAHEYHRYGLCVLCRDSLESARVEASPVVNPKTAQGDKKYPLHLLPLAAQVEVNRALEDGVTKYGIANWRTSGVPAHVYVSAAKRHIEQWFDGGQERASDSGVHNLGHAMACMAIIIDAQWNDKLIDDRPVPSRDTDLLLLRTPV